MICTKAKRVLWGVTGIAVAISLGWFIQNRFTSVRPLELKSPDGSGVGLMSLSPDGVHLVQSILSSPEPTIRFWNTDTGQVENPLTVTSLFPYSDSTPGIRYSVDQNPLVWAAFTTDSKKFEGIDSQGNMMRWDVATAQVEQNSASSIPNTEKVIAASPNAQILVTSQVKKNPKLLIRERTLGRQLSSLPPRSSAIKSVAFSPDSRMLASREGNNIIKILNAANGHVIRTLPKHRGIIAAFAFSSDGKTLVSSSYVFTKPWSCELHFWNVSDGTEKRAPIKAPDWIQYLTFSPTGYIAGTGSKSIFLWDITTGQLVTTLKGNWPLSFDKTGQKLACSVGDGFGRFKDAYIWDMKGVLRGVR